MFSGGVMRTFCVAAILVTVFTGTAFAQAGSMGGTVGKQDKSVSGSEEPAEPKSPHNPRHAVSPPKQSSEASCKLASIWANELAGVGSSVWTISSDGTAIERGLGSAQGHASLSGHTLTISYHTSLNNGTYVIQLNRTCSDGSGKVTILGGMLTGTVYNAVFTRTSE
jgi:hypothetical protein